MRKNALGAAVVGSGGAGACRRPAGAQFHRARPVALEAAADPEISPDGRWIAYARRSGDIMTDRFRPRSG